MCRNGAEFLRGCACMSHVYAQVCMSGREIADHIICPSKSVSSMLEFGITAFVFDQVSNLDMPYSDCFMFGEFGLHIVARLILSLSCIVNISLHNILLTSEM